MIIIYEWRVEALENCLVRKTEMESMTALSVSFGATRSITMTMTMTMCSFHRPFTLLSPTNSHSHITITQARNRNTTSDSTPFLKPDIIQQVLLHDDEDEDEDEDEESMMDDYFEEDQYVADNDNAQQLYAGDGVGGGGISLAGNWWDEEALRIAQEVSLLSFHGDLQIYAFKTTLNFTIQLRIDNLSNKYGSPSMEDIEAFSVAYRARLDEAELNKSIPENISLEVSSPGVERVIQIPHELDRFKDRHMYVKYVNEVAETGLSSESDGVFRLLSFDMESKCCTWGLADVKINREKAGKGRPLSRKQKDWRLSTSFDSLRLVRVYSDY